jgi:dynein heavy chain
MRLLNMNAATVSRCGMVFLDPKALGWKPVLESWLQQLDPQVKHLTPTLEALCGYFIEPTLKFVLESCKLPLPVSQCQLVKNLLNILDCFVPQFKPENSAFQWVPTGHLYDYKKVHTVWSHQGEIAKQGEFELSELAC